MRFVAKNKSWTVLIFTALSVAAVPGTGPLKVVKDINTSPAFETAAIPRDFVEMDGFTLFDGRSHAGGREVWRTDGTEAGTYQVKDIYPGGPSGLDPFRPARVGDTVFFAAWDGRNGVELWKTDGTEAGTVMVKDIYPNGSALRESIESTVFAHDVAAGLVFFPARDGMHGVELWRSDGTEAGTFLVRDINPGAASALALSSLRSTPAAGLLFFAAFDSAPAYGLWRTDGASEGTVLMTYLDDVSFAPSAEVGGALLFAGREAAGWRLWRSDGTPQGTHVLSDVRPTLTGAGETAAATLDGVMYFGGDDGAAGTELWRSDGTSEHTYLVEDIRPGSAGSAVSVIGALDGKALFTADDGVHGRELWVTDGTADGTDRITEIVPGANATLSVTQPVRTGAALYFVLDDGIHGPELWGSDGTEAGTRRLAASASGTTGPRALTPVGNRLYFEVQDPEHGREPWVTDGTPAGTTRLRDVRPGSRSSIEVNASTPGTLAGAVLFAADDGIRGSELWRTDGTPGGTLLVKDVNALARTEGSGPSGAAPLGDRMLFFAEEREHGREPWITDGTEEGTRLVTDFVPGPGTSFPNGGGFFRVLGGRGYFAATDPVNGSELRSTDGTEAGTALVKDIRPGSGSSFPQFQGSLDNVLLFMADDGVSGRELWATDGTEAGTLLVADIVPGSAGWSASPFVRIGDAAYFVAYEGSTGSYLWRTDGTRDGTARVVLMPPNLLEYPVVFQDALWFFTGDFDGIAPAALWRSDGTAAGTGPVGDLEVYGAFVMRAVGDNLYFVGIDANYSDAEVWATDGTIEGTRRMKDIEPGPGSSGIHEWAAVGDTLFFVASNLEHGPELWKSDGTEAGTRLVRETIPGPYSGFAPRGLRELAGVLVFLGHDGEHGFELWRSDGTEAGTYMIEDRLPGLESSSPSMLATFGNRVAFSVLDDAAGREPCIARASILTRQPKRAVADLAADVRALELPAGLEQGLLAKLSSVESALAKPSGHRVAIRLLEAFAREVEALVPAHLSPGDAEDLRAFAAEIERLLGMDNGSPPSIPRDGGQTLIPDFLRRGVRP